MNIVIDAGAAIAFLKDEEGASVLESALLDGGNTCAIHAVSLCEVFHETMQEYGEEKAHETVDALLSMGLNLHNDMDPSFWQRAGSYKARFEGISLAACFCLTLADQLSAELLTADRHEFEPIQDQLAFPIRFIR